MDGDALLVLFAPFVLLARTFAGYTGMPGILLNGLCAESLQLLACCLMTNCPNSSAGADQFP